MIRVERRARGIVWVVFDRPQARNAMTFAMWDQLRDLARELDADPAVRVIVFSGSEAGAFIAGTDINEFRAFTGADDGSAYEARIESVMRALEAIRVPTIAAISGACTGGGVSVAGQCDLRIGSPSTRIGVPIARTLGNCISLTNIARLGAVIGLDAVKTLIFTGRLLRAEEAFRVGLLTEVAESDEELPERAQEAAEALVELAPLTLRATKETVRRIRAAQLPDGGDLVRMCYGSRDFREGLTAFLEKRRPDWSGE